MGGSVIVPSYDVTAHPIVDETERVQFAFAKRLAFGREIAILVMFLECQGDKQDGFRGWIIGQVCFDV